MSFFTDALQSQTVTQVRASFLGIMQAAGLKASNWRITSFIFQMSEAVVMALQQYTKIVPIVVRGYASLDTATDPGDPDPYDPTNEAMAPGPGFLTDLGKNTYFTDRIEATFASGTWTAVNGGTAARTFAPYGLVFTWTGGSPPSPAPTYTNTPDATVYTNPDGTCTLAAGASVTLPISAQTIGSASSAPAGTITLTTTLLGVTGTNAAAVTGTDREDAATFRTNCKRAPARLSLAGPDDAVKYYAAHTTTGAALYNTAVPPAPVGITRVQTAQNIATGTVTAYYAAANAAAIAADVAAANANITTQAFAVPGCMTFVGLPAIENTTTVKGTAKIRARGGVPSATLKRLAAEGICASLARYSATLPIGGLDQDPVTHNGVLYADDLQAVAASGYAGIYDVHITNPAADQGFAVGNVIILASAAGDGAGSRDWTVTVVT
jgi:hypothetical protein